ncbi:hypothetical protein V8F44DRAFT_632575 [Aspergillus fumigatus]
MACSASEKLLLIHCLYHRFYQIFPSSPGSHYIHIHYLEGPPPLLTQGMQAVVDEVLTNANPWLHITRWANYLQGIQAHNLLACIAALEEDPIDTTEQGLLLAYIDKAAIQKHAPHDWTSLKYRMTA